MSAHDGPASGGRQKLVIGLIGGMGSGKSRVAAEFERRGARVISGDELGHEALRQPAIIAQIEARWGPGVLDEHGNIDRKKVGTIVFADPAQLRHLEGLVFPHIRRRIGEEIRAAQDSTKTRLVVLDAAVMLEAGWHEFCDLVMFVHAPRSARLKRLADQRGWTAEEVEARERAQLPLAEKISRAHYVIDNSGSAQETAQQIEDLLVELESAKPFSSRRGVV
jgi:dephospho-CoA kinase